MAIDKPTDYFRTKTYTGNGSTQSITFDESDNMKPDWVWIKDRDDGSSHAITDSVRGNTKYLMSNDTYQEETLTDRVTSFDSNGFSLSSSAAVNQSSSGNVAWCWLAGGTAPTKTYTVKVVSDSGNKYRFDDFGTSAVTLDLQEGGTYTFDQSDSSNSGHPFRFSTTSNGTHGGGSEYTTGVTTTGTPGSSGAKTVITVGSGVATLYYYCTQHSGMGGQANTNSTHGSSYFDGSIQTTVSPNVVSGFSIASYVGNATNSASFSHGLGVKPKAVLIKNRTTAKNWVYWQDTTNDGTSDVRLLLNSTASNYNNYHVTFGTDTITLGNTDDAWNKSGDNLIAYVFAEKKGFSSIGSFKGNGNADGTYVFTNHKPSWVLVKKFSSTGHWVLIDNKRDPINVKSKYLLPDDAGSEASFTDRDFLSNGFKMRNSNTDRNASGQSFLYISFAETPFVTSTGKIPTTAV